jgi:hypothetical protein
VAIDGYLTDGLVEALIKQLLSNGTKADLPGLSGNQSFLQLLMQLDDFDFCGRSGEDSLHPELPIISAVFLGGQYLSEDVFGVVLLLFFLGLGVVGCFGRAADEDGGGVFDEGTLLAKHRFSSCVTSLLYRYYNHSGPERAPGGRMGMVRDVAVRGLGVSKGFYPFLGGISD